MTGDSILCGVVVTYSPDDTVAEDLRAMVAECGRVVVIDNGSSPEAQARIAAVAGVELFALGENIGVAAALNMGAQRALDFGHRWIVTFDQDSRPLAGMVMALRATAKRHPHAVVVVPRIIEPGVGGSGYHWVRRHPRSRWLFQRVACEDADLPAVTMAVSSGSMIELESWNQLGGFEECLFIDYVDIDFCLKVVRAGRAIAVSAGAILEHHLGTRQPGVILGHEFRPTHHAAFRHYYIARNRVRIWRRHAWAVPHWALFDLCFAIYNALRVVAFEPDKWVKMKAMVLGTWDGAKGRTGACPAERWQVFRRSRGASGIE